MEKILKKYILITLLIINTSEAFGQFKTPNSYYHYQSDSITWQIELYGNDSCTLNLCSDFNKGFFYVIPAKVIIKDSLLTLKIDSIGNQKFEDYLKKHKSEPESFYTYLKNFTLININERYFPKHNQIENVENEIKDNKIIGNYYFSNNRLWGIRLIILENNKYSVITNDCLSTSIEKGKWLIKENALKLIKNKKSKKVWDIYFDNNLLFFNNMIAVKIINKDLFTYTDNYNLKLSYTYFIKY